MQKSFDGSDPDADTVRALNVEAMRLQMTSNFSRLLHEMVFANPLQPDENGRLPDEKSRLSFQRTLDDEEGNTVLALIWKESRHVSSVALSAAGMSRAFPEESVTAFGLADILAADRSHVEATISRVRNIAIAGAAYGLLERQRQKGDNKVRLVGTDLLHRLMVRVGRENAQAYATFFAGSKPTVRRSLLHWWQDET